MKKWLLKLHLMHLVNVNKQGILDLISKEEPNHSFSLNKNACLREVCKNTEKGTHGLNFQE